MPTNELEQGQTENGSAIQWFLTAYDATVLADFISVKANEQDLPPSEFPLLNYEENETTFWTRNGRYFINIRHIFCDSDKNSVVRVTSMY